MNLLSKKLGEVHAFAIIGLELIDRSNQSGVKAFGRQLTATMLAQFKLQVKILEPFADKAKTDKTVTKLRDMMEQYIGDNWDNPIEILEWSGFFLGAAEIHWSLVSKLLSDANNKEMEKFAVAQGNVINKWMESNNKQIKVLASNIN